MIETDKQRRWWFATHPEYSWGRAGTRGHPHNKSRGDSWSPHRRDDSGTSRDSDDEDSDPVTREFAESLEAFRQAIQADMKGLEADPHTLLDLFPYRRLLTSPAGTLRNFLRNMATSAVVSAAKRAGSGPGKWVEVARGPNGLAHQGAMSGQPIRERGGKLYIKEYDVNGVKFDDYKSGTLYEYKGPHGNLLNKEREFHHWVSGAKKFRDQAIRQTKAAQGVPVVWRVGARQVKAFQKAVGRVPGLSIEP
ncbi:MAG: Tox-REase-5 domain-containing protein [Thermodesulfobacteriota bacterium]